MKYKFNAPSIFKKLKLSLPYLVALVSGSVLCCVLAYACYMGANRRTNECFEKVTVLIRIHFLVPIWIFILLTIITTTFYLYKLHFKPNERIKLLPLIVKSAFWWICAVFYVEHLPRHLSQLLLYILISLFLISLSYLYFEYLDRAAENKKKKTTITALCSLILISSLSAYYVFGTRTCYEGMHFCRTYKVECFGPYCGRTPYYKVF